MNGDQVAAVIMTALIVVGVTVSMLALAWASRRSDRLKPQRLEALEDRLGRVEQAIDTVAAARWIQSQGRGGLRQSGGPVLLPRE